MRTRYYHGGVKGLLRGQKILPPIETGKSTLLQFAKEIEPDGVQRPDKVYITTDLDAAKMFAFSFPYGDVYEVTPSEDLEDDPDCTLPGLSYQCSFATIKSIVVYNVR